MGALKIKTKNGFVPVGGGSGGETVQTDWKQMDETAPDFLKNKPFGDEAIVILEEQELAVDTEQGLCSAPVSGQIKEDDFLSVVFDGVVYETKVIGINGNILFGNTELAGVAGGNGEPFFGMYIEGVVLIASSDQSAASHTVKISAMTAVKISERYLPSLKFYFNQAPGYLYTDKECTTKATIADMPDNADFDIGLTASGGAVISWYRPIENTSKLNSIAIGYGSVFLLNRGELIELHTVEYTPTT